MNTQRQLFEAWIKAPPFEHMCDINGEESAWPGAYKRYETELAWEAWQAATREIEKSLDFLLDGMETGEIVNHLNYSEPPALLKYKLRKKLDELK